MSVLVRVEGKRRRMTRNELNTYRVELRGDTLNFMRPSKRSCHSVYLNPWRSAHVLAFGIDKVEGKGFNIQCLLYTQVKNQVLVLLDDMVRLAWVCAM